MGAGPSATAEPGRRAAHLPKQPRAHQRHRERQSGECGGRRHLQYASSFPVIQNSIVWGNRAPTGPNQYTYSSESVSTDDPATPADQRADDDYGDLHLQATSPAIGGGDNQADLDGVGPGSTTIADVPINLAAGRGSYRGSRCV